MTAGDRIFRLMLRSYPRALRHAHGEEMAQLVRDRQRIDRERGWHLWPAVVWDTICAAPAAHRDELSATHRAVALGALTAVATLAVLSDGAVRSMPVVLPALAIAVVLTRWRPPRPSAGDRRAARRWARTGAALLVATAPAWALGRDLPSVVWPVCLAALLSGVLAVATSVVLRAGDLRRPVRA